MRRSKIDYTAWYRIGSELQKRFGRVFKTDTADDDDMWLMLLMIVLTFAVTLIGVTVVAALLMHVL